MAQVQPGSTVTLHYIGTLDNGRIFQSTEEVGPLTVTIGADQLFPALERALLGMEGGETKNVVLSAEEAYGPRRDENVLTVERSLFPAGSSITVGQKLSIDFAGGASRVMRVIAVEDDRVTLDGNHPLAGCELTFALRVERVG